MGHIMFQRDETTLTLDKGQDRHDVFTKMTKEKPPRIGSEYGYVISHKLTSESRPQENI